MIHQPYRTWLIDEPELAAAERAALTAHLGECVECASVREGLARLDALFTAPPLIPAPRNFTARWQGRLAAQASRPRWFFGGAALSFGALAVLALLFAPLLGGLAQVAVQPGVTAGMLSGADSFARLVLTVGSALCTGALALLRALNTQPVLAGFALAGFGILLIWARLFRQLAPAGGFAR